VPCGHSVVCEDCLEFFSEYHRRCPTCKLNYFATKKA
jgi:RNA polymerase subunit RPABC4/transcription elongation factor Spt4